MKVDEEDKIKLTPESIFNKILSEPESDLGSPETENLEVPESGEVEVTPATEEKPSTE